MYQMLNIKTATPREALIMVTFRSADLFLLLSLPLKD